METFAKIVFIIIGFSTRFFGEFILPVVLYVYYPSEITRFYLIWMFCFQYLSVILIEVFPKITKPKK